MIALVWRSPVSVSGKWVMFALGIASVVAAMAYTLGKRPYGYYALGDVMVFLFFGLLGVVGSYYLQGGELSYLPVWLLAIIFGGLSASVLHINNLRDREKDKENGKTTLANLLGNDVAIKYQAVVFAIVIILSAVYAVLTQWGISVFLLGLWVLVTLWKALKYADSSKRHNDYNRCLALTVKLTLLLSLPAFVVGLLT